MRRIKPTAVLGMLLPLAGALSLFLASCRSSTEPELGGRINGNSPRQITVVGDPVIRRHQHPDSAVVYIEVIAPDSTPHAEWWPTMLLVETDRGYRQEVILVPHACLRPQDIGLGFPFNFEWLACDGIGINNNTLLSADHIKNIERLVNGKLSAQRNFLSQRGATYYFRVPVGPEAVAEAIRRVDRLSYMDEVYHLPHTPPCVLADVVPPPPCPPWLLGKKFYYSFGSAATDALPVSPNGWVRATYTEPNGTRKITQFSFSPPDAEDLP